MANFPALKPTARSFQLGQYPVKTYRAMSGAVVRRSFGNKAFGYTLELAVRRTYQKPQLIPSLIITTASKVAPWVSYCH
jgi:hypothetical protein